MNSSLLSFTQKISSSNLSTKIQFNEEYVASNRLTPVATLALLSKSSNYEVKVAVAENCTTSLCTLLEMARDINPDLRFTMAENSNLPIAVLTILSEDENPFVACQAERSLRRIREGDRITMATVVSISSNARGVASRSFKHFIQTLTRIAQVG